MTKEQRKLLDDIKKMGVSENVVGNDFEKIKMLESFKGLLADSNDIKEVEAEIAKLRESPEFKENEIKKKLERIKEDF